MTFAQL